MNRLPVNPSLVGRHGRRMSRALVTIVLFAAMPVMAAAALPDTPTGKLAGALIQHVNADTPADLLAAEGGTP